MAGAELSGFIWAPLPVPPPQAAQPLRPIPSVADCEVSGPKPLLRRNRYRITTLKFREPTPKESLGVSTAAGSQCGAGPDSGAANTRQGAGRGGVRCA